MKKIIVVLLPLVLVILAFRYSNSKTVTGKVTDPQGQPLSNVHIHEHQSKSGTSSSADGSYHINVNNDQSVLIFEATGYLPQTVPVMGRTTINVILSPVSPEADSVTVVTALGIKRDAKSLGYGYTQPYNRPVSSMDYESRKVGNQYQPNSPDDNDNPPLPYDREGYDHITENRFSKVSDNPLSTFSIDVDAASYSNVRRFLNEGQLPPAGAVRIEEMVNYFKYAYPQPGGDQPFSINTEIADAPWNKDHKLVLIGLQGKNIPTATLPSSNLVFLIDVSGSMDEPDKLPLVKASLKMLVDQLREKDRVAMVVYAGAAGLVLPSTSGAEKNKIKEAIDRLDAGGSTAGGEGIKLAYNTARQYLVKGGNNRVILCTDGDFNVGASSDDALERLIEQERESGVFLTVLGYGTGNYQDSKMQKLADKGNGNHAYIDGMSEAKKVLVNEFGGTLFTIAKDVKLQVEFNPATVQGYRLIGYENRMMAKEDFNNDKKDAGELGSGHTVTALYEVIPVGVNDKFLESVDPLKYQQPAKPVKTDLTNEILTVKFRYKEPDGNESKLIVHPVIDNEFAFAKTTDNFRFSASVAEFGMLLRNSEFKSSASFEQVLQNARLAKGSDEEGYRSEFVRLVENAQALSKSITPGKEVSKVD